MRHLEHESGGRGCSQTARQTDRDAYPGGFYRNPPAVEFRKLTLKRKDYEYDVDEQISKHASKHCIMYMRQAR